MKVHLGDRGRASICWRTRARTLAPNQRTHHERGSQMKALGLSVVDRLNAELLESLKVVLHGLERFRGVPLPIGDLARDA